MSTKGNTRKVGRSAITGQFATVKKAQQDQKHYVVETIRNGKKK
jgi:hypothetical protein